MQTFNLDLPGTKAPSIISDNFAGALELTRTVLDACEAEFNTRDPMLFVGGRAADHNTRERLRGFRAAHAERGLPVPFEFVLAGGYAAEKAEGALNRLVARQPALPTGFFVNSTISLEGVVRWLRGHGTAAPPGAASDASTSIRSPSFSRRRSPWSGRTWTVCSPRLFHLIDGQVRPDAGRTSGGHRGLRSSWCRR